MREKVIIIALFMFMKQNSYAQNFDSVCVYVVSVKSFFSIKVDKNTIKNETEPTTISNSKIVSLVHEILMDSRKGDYINQAAELLPIRALFEFFYEGKVSKFIMLPSKKLLYLDGKIFECNEENLKLLDNYVDRFSSRFGTDEK